MYSKKEEDRSTFKLLTGTPTGTRPSGEGRTIL